MNPQYLVAYCCLVLRIRTWLNGQWFPSIFGFFLSNHILTFFWTKGLFCFSLFISPSFSNVQPECIHFYRFSVPQIGEETRVWAFIESAQFLKFCFVLWPDSYPIFLSAQLFFFGARSSGKGQSLPFFYPPPRADAFCPRHFAASPVPNLRCFSEWRQSPILMAPNHTASGGQILRMKTFLFLKMERALSQMIFSPPLALVPPCFRRLNILIFIYISVYKYQTPKFPFQISKKACSRLKSFFCLFVLVDVGLTGAPRVPNLRTFLPNYCS